MIFLQVTSGQLLCFCVLSGNSGDTTDLRIAVHGGTIYGMGRKTEPRYIEAGPAAGPYGRK